MEQDIRKPVRNLIIRADVGSVKKQAARELRKNMTPAGFYCHAAALVVEIDGLIHEGQVDYDKERDSVLSSLGLRVLRFTNHQVQEDLATVLRTISTEAKRPSSPSTPPLPLAGERAGIGVSS